MAITSLYATIDELELETSKFRAVAPEPKYVVKSQPIPPLAIVRTAAAVSTAVLLGSEVDGTSAPPPLPPPNQSSALHSPPLVKTKSKPTFYSEENVCQALAAVKLSNVQHLSNSSPSLNFLGKDSAQGLVDLTDSANFPVYSVVKKKKKDASDVPPPLPPPLALDNVSEAEVAVNGELTCLEQGFLFIPNHDDELKTHRAGPHHPKVHVYETVPDDIAHVRPKVKRHSSGKGSFRRACRKKKYHAHKTEKDRGSRLSITPLPGLISLSELEPLPPSGETMRLCDFVKKFCHYLPLCVRVDEGYCGTEERFVISSGDVYNLHFVKNEKVVTIRDCGGNNFSTPLNSAIEFGLLYNPSNDFKTALIGHQFKTVSDIVGTKSTPRIICATRTHNMPDSKASVQAGEVLIVKKVSRTTVMRKPTLKVVSLKSNEDKILQEDCEGNFSTSPELVKLYLPEILEHFGACFPLDAMLYMKPAAKEDLPLHLTTDIVTLTQTAVETSIIASTCWDEGRQEELSEEDRALVAIPVDLDIEVTLLGRESDNSKLYESTRNFFETFSSRTVTDMKNSGGMQSGERSSLAQTKLYKAVRKDYPSEGTEIKLPFRLSGVFDGDVSPLMKKPPGDKPIYYDLEVDVTSSNSSPSQSSPAKENGETSPTTTTTSSDSVRTHPFALPPEPSPAYLPAPLPTPNSATTRNSSSHASVCRDLASKFYTTVDDKAFDGDADDNYDYIMTTRKHSSVKLPRRKPDKGQDKGPGLPQTPPISLSRPSRVRADSLFVSPNKSLPNRCARELAGSEDGGSGVRGEKMRRKSMTFDELSKNYTKLEIELQELKRELWSTRDRQVCEGGVSEEQKVTRTHSMLYWTRPKSKSTVKATSLEDQERNKKELRMLDHDEILVLLEAMNLGQYKDNFRKEQVDGEILADCDDAMLEQDLLLVSAIHRNRLMKLITGRHSASSLMAGENNLYSILDRKT